MSEDKKLAEAMVERDFKNVAKQIADFRRKGVDVSVSDGTELPDLGDGSDVFIPMIIGARGKLTKDAARSHAAVWQQLTKRYPKAIFYIQLLGYDEDPREIWEIAEVARYVRRWARDTGMDDPEAAVRLLDVAGRSVLAACGVFGDELKREALAEFRPTSAN